jgi:hypothetical protein
MGSETPDGGNAFGERIDEDPAAETNDTRLRVERGDHETYKLKRERYCLVEFESAAMADDGDGYERYDWSPDETFTLRSPHEAEQAARMLAAEDAFDPNVLFFRQRDGGGDDAE